MRSATGEVVGDSVEVKCMNRTLVVKVNTVESPSQVPWDGNQIAWVGQVDPTGYSWRAGAVATDGVGAELVENHIRHTEWRAEGN